jgi:chorismate mutase
MTPDEGQAALDKLRADIDELDLQLLALFNQRARVVEAIGDIKRVASIPIYEPKREELVFSNVLENNGGPLPDDAVRRLYERIIDEMRTLQRERMRRAQSQAAPGEPQASGQTEASGQPHASGQTRASGARESEGDKR